MKVLFLDIDGVLNSRTFYLQKVGTPDGRDLLAFDVEHFDPRAVDLLNGVISHTDALVVISSAWRLIHSPGAISRMLRQKGFHGRVIDRTPGGCDAFNAYGARGRNNEIRLWLDGAREVESFAIVDDDHDAGVGYAPYFVQTEFETGLTETHAEKLIKILMRESDDE